MKFDCQKQPVVTLISSVSRNLKIYFEAVVWFARVLLSAVRHAIINEVIFSGPVENYI